MSKLAIRPVESWQDNLRRSSFRLGFKLQLSHVMLEFLCAVADDVEWDRHLNKFSPDVDSWLSTEMALTRRGLIERKRPRSKKTKALALGLNYCRLTPAGQAVVELVKMAGVYVEAVEATVRRLKGA